jgi:hypothetical protein
LDNLVNEGLIDPFRCQAEFLKKANELKKCQVVLIFTQTKKICALPAKNHAM